MGWRKENWIREKAIRRWKMGIRIESEGIRGWKVKRKRKTSFTISIRKIEKIKRRIRSQS